MGQTSNLAINPSLYAKLQYDPLKDFAPVSLVSLIPIAIMVAAKAPYKSAPDREGSGRESGMTLRLSGTIW